MEKDFWKQYNTSYAEIQGMIDGIAIRIAGKYATDELMMELESQGWVLVLEALPNFDPSRGAKVTTYLWRQLNGRLLRYAVRWKETHQQIQPEEECPRRSTECIQNSSVFATNPYEMSPDVIYEKNERASQWQYIKSNFESDIQACLSKLPNNADMNSRVKATRCRKKRISKLKDLIHQLLYGK